MIKGYTSQVPIIWGTFPQALRIKTLGAPCHQRSKTPLLSSNRSSPPRELMGPLDNRWIMENKASEGGSSASTPSFSSIAQIHKFPIMKNWCANICCPTLFTQFTCAPRAIRLSTTSAHPFSAADKSGVSPFYTTTTAVMWDTSSQVKHAEYKPGTKIRNPT